MIGDRPYLVSSSVSLHIRSGTIKEFATSSQNLTTSISRHRYIVESTHICQELSGGLVMQRFLKGLSMPIVGDASGTVSQLARSHSLTVIEQT